MASRGDKTSELHESAKQIALRDLVVKCPELRQLERRLGSLNLFEVLNLADHEIRHSNLLAWLLDPNGNHGLRDVFLRRWLMRIFHDSDADHSLGFDPVDIDSASWRSVRVLREWQHIDLLLEMQLSDAETWVVAIENKVHSSQHSDQLERYRLIVEGAYRRAKTKFVLLSVRAERPKDSAYIVATYRQIREELEQCVKEQAEVIAYEPRMILEHYCKLIENRFMPDSETERLATAIYTKHKLALDVIFAHRPNLVQALTDRVHEIARQRCRELDASCVKPYKGEVFLLPDIWKTPVKNNQGQIAWLSIYFYNFEDVRLSAVVKKTDSDWRAGFIPLMGQPPFEASLKRSDPPKEWPVFRTINSEMGLDEVEVDSIDGKAELIWQWVTAEIRKPEFQSVLKIVATQLQKFKMPTTS